MNNREDGLIWWLEGMLCRIYGRVDPFRKGHRAFVVGAPCSGQEEGLTRPSSTSLTAKLDRFSVFDGFWAQNPPLRTTANHCFGYLSWLLSCCAFMPLTAYFCRSINSSLKFEENGCPSDATTLQGKYTRWNILHLDHVLFGLLIFFRSGFSWSLWPSKWTAEYLHWHHWSKNLWSDLYLSFIIHKFSWIKYCKKAK